MAEKDQRLNEIPKLIHYCWFGGNELPDLALKCIESWKKYCPDYEIIEWNESNFDLGCSDFVNEAYKAKKWAFVSDYARLKVIYDNGGIYLDTDVELVKSLDSLLKEKCYFAEETTGYVATGLGFGARKHDSTVALLLDEYNGKHFINADGTYDMEQCPIKNTKPLLKLGYKFDGKDIWRCENFVVFPPEYFCPLDFNTNKMHITDNTMSIHLYDASWLNFLDRIILKIEGSTKHGITFKIRRLISFPLRVVNKLKKNGFSNTVKQILS